MNLSRNDLCWCGSNKKYKKCHLEIDEKIAHYKAQGCIVPNRSLIKNKEQIEGIKKSAKINTAVLDLVAKNIKAGMSTEEINTLVYDYTISQGAIPAPLNYEGFPKSVCTSINDEVCHGIPDKNIILKDGDIIKQSKPEGYQVTQGTTLTITIYKAPDDSEKCNPNEEVCD